MTLEGRFASLPNVLQVDRRVAIVGVMTRPRCLTTRSLIPRGCCGIKRAARRWCGPCKSRSSSLLAVLIARTLSISLCESVPRARQVCPTNYQSIHSVLRKVECRLPRAQSTQCSMAIMASPVIVERNYHLFEGVGVCSCRAVAPSSQVS